MNKNKIKSRIIKINKNVELKFNMLFNNGYNDLRSAINNMGQSILHSRI